MNKASLLTLALAAFAASAPLAFAADSMMTTSSMTAPAMSTSMMATSNLTVGSRGSDVITLQTWLETNGYLTMPMGVSKGYFGSVTRAALMRYQAAAGVSSTGYYGPLTRAALMSKLGMMSTGSMNTTGDMASNGSMTASTSAMTGVMVGGALMTPDRDIVANALNANNITTLVAAVKAAGLVATLQGTGPFTVFAPDNAAFAKLPAGTVDTLLMPTNKAKLVDILTYHVVAGRYTSADLMNGMTLTTVEGKKLTIGKVNGQITVNGSAMVQTPDVISSNGVTFVIDSVLMPQ